MLNASLEGIPPHQIHHLAHHDGCFVVDNRVIDQPGIAHVVERLADRGTPLRPVLRNGCGHIGLEPVERMVDLRKQGSRNLCRKIVGKHLLRPDIVEPLHRDRITEPHVGRLVRDQFRAMEQLIRGRMGRQEERIVVVEGGSGMLHSSELKTGQHHKVILGKGVRHTRELLQPIDGEGDLTGYFGQLGHPGGICLPIVGSQFLRCKVLILKFTGGKSKEIGRQGFGGSKSNASASALPAVRQHRTV